MTMSSLVAMLGFADLGIGNGLLNAVSDALGKDNRADAIDRSRAPSSPSAPLPWSSVFSSSWSIRRPMARSLQCQLIDCCRRGGPSGRRDVWRFCLRIAIGIVSRVRAGYQEGFC